MENSEEKSKIPKKKDMIQVPPDAQEILAQIFQSEDIALLYNEEVKTLVDEYISKNKVLNAKKLTVNSFKSELEEFKKQIERHEASAKNADKEKKKEIEDGILKMRLDEAEVDGRKEGAEKQVIVAQMELNKLVEKIEKLKDKIEWKKEN